MAWRWLIGAALVFVVVLNSCGPSNYSVAQAKPPDVDQSPYYPGPSTAPVSSPISSTGSSGSAAATNLSLTVSQAGNTIRIVDFAFNPSSLTIPVGTTVTWTNTGMQTHTSTADNGAWNSGPLRPGATFAQAFPAAGTFSFHCMIHPTMTGTITVTSSGAPSASANLAAGWNLVAGPTGTVAPGANGPLYTLRAGQTAYDSVPSGTPFEGGVGYWAFFNAPAVLSLPVVANQPFRLPLPASQWIMVGNPNSSAVTVSGADSILTYSSAQGYQTASTLLPGQGAWAWSTTGGTLTINPSG
jgi:plastocyanin